MTLSGNLGFVPLDEVLRLLARSGNDGMVQITNSNASGRVFVTGKGISLATTLGDYGLKDHLISSGYISDEDANKVESGSAGFGEFFGEGTEGLKLLREITVESIHQLDSDDADFQVVKDETSPFASPKPFDLEGILEESRDRAARWEQVSKVIPDLDAVLRINRQLDRETVEMNKDSWRIVSEIGSGTSVRDLSGRLGTTDFAVAKVAAEMTKDKLLYVDDSAPGYGESSYVAHIAAAVAEDSVEKTDAAHDKSWWDEPESEEVGSVSDDGFASVLSAEEASAEITDSDFESIDQVDESTRDESPVTIDEETDNSVDGDSEDTEAFLEQVFSELGPEAEESDGGHGLMRRRRMGSILRELGED